MRKFVLAAFVFFLLIPALAGAVDLIQVGVPIPGPGFSLLLADICTITDDANPQIGKGGGGGGQVELGPNTIIEDPDPIPTRLVIPGPGTSGPDKSIGEGPDPIIFKGKGKSR